MLASLPDFLTAYWMYLVGVAVLCAVGCYFSKKFFERLKKLVILSVIAFCLVAGYEMITGRSIFKLPGDVDQKLSERPEKPETGRRYYKGDEERYGQKVPE